MAVRGITYATRRWSPGTSFLQDEHPPIGWQGVLTGLAYMAALFALTLALMAIAFVPLVYLGWIFGAARQSTCKTLGYKRLNGLSETNSQSSR